MAIGGEVIIGVISSIVYDGLKIVTKNTQDSMSRRQRIGQALDSIESNDEQHSPIITAAIKDLARVLGHDRGIYSTEVAAFLHDVARSIVPEALAQFALCGKDPGDAFAPFDLIYKSYNDLPFESRKVFNALYEAISLRFSIGIDNKILFEATKAQTSEILSKLDNLSTSLRHALTIHDPLEAKQYSELRLKVAKGIEAANKQLNVETSHGARKIPIKSLVIQPRINVLTNGSDLPNAHRDSPVSRSQTLTYLQFRRTLKRAVMLGDPGGGKSTLTQLICADLSSQILLESNARFHKEFQSSDLRLPLRVILRTFDARLNNNPSYNIFDYLVDDIKLHCDNDSELARRLLRQLLTLGQAVLIFDGLDEILEIGPRRNMASTIEQVCNIYAACPSFVTSRLVGYRDAPLSNDFKILLLSRFNDEEVTKFSKQLIFVVEGVKKVEADKKAHDFIQQTSSTAKDLRENPLMLGLMVYLFIARGDVPNIVHDWP